MKKKTFLFMILLLPVIMFGQDNEAMKKDKALASFLQLSPQQIYDTANYYLDNNNYDSALICYNLIINTISKNADFEQQDVLQNAYNRAAYIYISFSDYRIAYDFLLKRLQICEKYDLESCMSGTYMNIGYIYFYLKQYEMSKEYFSKSLELCSDSATIVLILNNLCANEMALDKTDSSLYFFDKAMQISKQHNDVYQQNLLNNYGNYFLNKKQYDSAFYYFFSSLELSKASNMIEKEAHYLSSIGDLYFKINKIDSALYYIDLSNKIAHENKFLSIITNNYLILSEIEKEKGHYKNALNHYTTYTNLKDSIYNADVFGSVNQLQRLYEISKTNQHIEELVFERHIKENTIYYQKIILFIVLGVLLMVTNVLIIIISQKRKLHKAYKQLVDKTNEIVELQDNSSKTKKPKTKKNTLTDEAQKELLRRILIEMDNTEIICDPEFTVDKLAKILKTNKLYVSKAINDGLDMNFRSLLNRNRIKEAVRLFTNHENTIYTIEFISNQVGFNSQSVFRQAFKENTGVYPNFYLKSLKESN